MTDYSLPLEGGEYKGDPNSHPEDQDVRFTITLRRMQNGAVSIACPAPVGAVISALQDALTYLEHQNIAALVGQNILKILEQRDLERRIREQQR